MTHLLYLAYVAVHIYCAYYVYTDAKKRGMNDIVWALVSFFVCFPIGFVIYLIARKPAA